MPIKYGRALEIRRDGEVTAYAEQVFANTQLVQNITVMSEVVMVEEYNDVLKIVLQMLDDQKAGKIDLVGIQCLNNQDTGSMRVKKYWVER